MPLVTHHTDGTPLRYSQTTEARWGSPRALLARLNLRHKIELYDTSNNLLIPPKEYNDSDPRIVWLNQYNGGLWRATLMRRLEEDTAVQHGKTWRVVWVFEFEKKADAALFKLTWG